MTFEIELNSRTTLRIRHAGILAAMIHRTPSSPNDCTCPVAAFTIVCHARAKIVGALDRAGQRTARSGRGVAVWAELARTDASCQDCFRAGQAYSDAYQRDQRRARHELRYGLMLSSVYVDHVVGLFS
ncbi:hypothetical protein D3C71_1446020 [compost metagenome]